MLQLKHDAPTDEGKAVMRGADEQPGSMFSYVSLEERVPQDHPLRAIRRITDRALARLSPQLGALYVHFGRPSVPPEQLLRALLLQVLYTIRSERQLMEQLDYNLLFRWFVGLSMDERVWSPTTFTKNRDRLLRGDIAQGFFEAVRLHADSERLLSDDHFTVDSTLLEAWASHKSFRPRDEPPSSPGRGNPSVNSHGQRRANDTHQSVPVKARANVQQAVPFFWVQDIEQSVRFYVDGLGFDMTKQWVDEGKLRWCWLALGDTALMLQELWREGPHRNLPEGKVGTGVSINFICQDALTVYRDITSRGLLAGRPFVGNHMWVTHVVDPDGYSLHFASPTDVPEETVFSQDGK
jgi:transposase/catechol 2,3-dioxygenase-like lactoylglutathione lyase family enzyme